MTSDNTPTPAATEDAALDLARMALYRFFASALADPLSKRWTALADEPFRRAASAAAELLRDEAAAVEDFRLAPGELPPDWLASANGCAALCALAERVAADPSEALAEHERVFGLTLSKECPPCETEFCPQTFSVFRSQRMADIAGFYRAFGVEPSADEPERPDHAALELEFMAWLIAKERFAWELQGDAAAERAELCRDAQRRFASEHLAWWLPAFARALWRKAEGVSKDAAAASLNDPRREPATFHGAVARGLAAFVAAERALLGLPAPEELAAPRPADLEEPGETECADCSLAQLT